jgi:hypothetical protein
MLNLLEGLKCDLWAEIISLVYLIMFMTHLIGIRDYKLHIFKITFIDWAYLCFLRLQSAYARWQLRSRNEISIYCFFRDQHRFHTSSDFHICECEIWDRDRKGKRTENKKGIICIVENI